MLSLLKKNSKKRILSVGAWCLFDWANSAFPTLILTFIFATYFTKSVAKTPILGTSEWGDAIAFAGLCIAILGPIFGAIADHRGSLKPSLGFFTLLAIVAATMLGYTKANITDINWALTWVVLGTIGFEVGMVFYNAMLSNIVEKKYLGRFSGWAWGFGYIGGLTSLSLMLLILKVAGTGAIRVTGPFTALWMLLFCWPLFVWTTDRPPTKLPYSEAIKRGLHSLYQNLKAAKKNKEIFKFLLARIFYIDGLNTIFSFGGIYAAGTFGMSFSEVIKFGIAMNVAAGIGAMLFSWMDDLKGSKLTILTSLLIMIICSTTMLLTHSKLYFWLFGMGLSLCVGPTQAASRSLLIRLSPRQLITEMFGLYALSGKATSFLGPWILANLTLAFNSQRVGMSTVVYFLTVGGIILLFVKESR